MERPRVMRLSAGLVALGFVLLVAQGSFSEGAVPFIVPVPIGTGPLVAGMIAIGGGLLVGLVGGTRRFRLAVLLAILGIFLAGFGLLFIYSRNPSAPAPAVTVNVVALALAVLVWGAAVVLGLSALRTHGSQGGVRNANPASRDIPER